MAVDTSKRRKHGQKGVGSIRSSVSSAPATSATGVAVPDAALQDAFAPVAVAERVGALKLPELRAAMLLDVGISVDQPSVEQAMFHLAKTLRLGDGAFFAAFATFLLQHVTQSQAQIFQDVFALFIAKDKRGGFFVEVGTGDGKLISNTYMLEKNAGWDGIVVEPNPVFLPMLRDYRSCKISTDCVYDVTGRSIIFEQTADPEFSRIANGHSDLHDGKRNDGVTGIMMTTVSLNDLLDRMQAPPRMEYLSLDVEGSELEIIQALDFARWRFDCISIEHNWTASRDTISALLVDEGYVQVFEHFAQWDDWYVHRDVLKGFPEAAPLLAAADLTQDSPTAEALRSWSHHALQQGDLAIAEFLAKEELKLGGDLAPVYRTLADIATRRGHRSQALNYWRAAITANPQDYWAHIGLAGLLAARGAFNDAVAALTKAIEFDVDVSIAEEMLGAIGPKAARVHPG